MKGPILKGAAALILAAGLAMPARGFAQVATAPTVPASKTAVSMKHHKVDCSQVMSELNGGKKAKDVAGDMKISTSSVYRCKKKEVAETSKKGTTSAAPSSAATKTTH
jgi:hypothetical protein